MFKPAITHLSDNTSDHNLRHHFFLLKWNSYIHFIKLLASCNILMHIINDNGNDNEISLFRHK